MQLTILEAVPPPQIRDRVQRLPRRKWHNTGRSRPRLWHVSRAAASRRLPPTRWRSLVAWASRPSPRRSHSSLRSCSQPNRGGPAAAALVATRWTWPSRQTGPSDHDDPDGGEFLSVFEVNQYEPDELLRIGELEFRFFRRCTTFPVGLCASQTVSTAISSTPRTLVPRQTSRPPRRLPNRRR